MIASANFRLSLKALRTPVLQGGRSRGKGARSQPRPRSADGVKLLVKQPRIVKAKAMKAPKAKAPKAKAKAAKAIKSSARSVGPDQAFIDSVSSDPKFAKAFLSTPREYGRFSDYVYGCSSADLGRELGGDWTWLKGVVNTVWQGSRCAETQFARCPASPAAGQQGGGR